MSEKAVIMMTDAELAAIESWLKEQEGAGDFGGVCEYDHIGAEEHIVALLAEVKRLRAELADELRTRPPFACPTCDWHFQTWALRDKHLESGACSGIEAAIALTQSWTFKRIKELAG